MKYFQVYRYLRLPRRLNTYYMIHPGNPGLLYLQADTRDLYLLTVQIERQDPQMHELAQHYYWQCRFSV